MVPRFPTFVKHSSYFLNTAAGGIGFAGAAHQNPSLFCRNVAGKETTGCHPLEWHPQLLELLVKLAGRARDINTAGNIPFAIFHALYDAGGFAALGTVRALGGIHHFFAIRRFGDLSHGSYSPAKVMRL